jgi:hypothetical protein
MILTGTAREIAAGMEMIAAPAVRRNRGPDAATATLFSADGVKVPMSALTALFVQHDKHGTSQDCRSEWLKSLAGNCASRTKTPAPDYVADHKSRRRLTGASRRRDFCGVA